MSTPSARATPRKWKTRCWTFEEVAAELPENNQPVELWDGKLLMAPSRSFEHQQIVDRFHDCLKA